jgi:Amt family ammonium transporter
MLDFSGSGVIHLTGGLTALFATIVLGPRRGRFHDSNGIPREKPSFKKGHSISLQLLGTMILWFGWYGFNPGSALLVDVEYVSGVAAQAALTTTLAAACGALSAMFTSAFVVWKTEGEFYLDLVVAMNGLLSGLVSITAGCAFVESWASVVIGLIAGLIYLASSAALIHLKIDDVIDAIPVHLGNGLWGVFAVGLFACPDSVHAVYGADAHGGVFYTPDDAALLAAQVVGILFIIAWISVTMYPFFLSLNYFGWFRVNELEEIIGLDATYHGKNGMEDLFGDTSATDEEERKEAFLKRRKERTKPHKTINELIAGSWGELDISTPSSDDDFVLSEEINQKTFDTSTSSKDTGSKSDNSRQHPEPKQKRSNVKEEFDTRLDI